MGLFLPVDLHICMGCVRESPLLVPEPAAATEKGGISASAAHDDSMGLEQAGLSSYAVMVRSCLLNLERLCLEKGGRRVRPESGSPQSAGGQHQQRTHVQGITLSKMILPGAGAGSSGYSVAPMHAIRPACAGPE